MNNSGLFTVPYFLVSTPGSSAFWYGRPSWFYRYPASMRWPSAINTMRSISTILRKKIEVFGQSRIRVIQYFFLFCVYIYIYIYFFFSSSSLIALSYEQFTTLFDVQFIEYLSEDQKGRCLLIIKQRNGDCVLLSD